MRRVLLAGLIAIAWTSAAWAETAGSENNDGSASLKKNSRLFPPRVSMGRVYYLPTVHYREETGFGIGGEVLYPFRWPGSGPVSRPSDLRAKGRVTFKGQLQLELSTTVFWSEGSHYLKAKVRYYDTAQRFYGIGPDTPSSAKEIYRPRRYLAYVEVFHRIVPNLLGGVRVEAEHFESIEVDPNGQLNAPEYLAFNETTMVGAGVALDWDTRDSRYYPTRGSYYQAFALIFDENLGSQLNMKNYHFDLRNYFLMPTGHILATQIFVFDTPDNPPFWRMASLGGRSHTRGYRRDRYLDHLLVAAQAEYRFPLWKRFGTSAFLGWAAVAPGWSTLQAKYLRPTLGFGLNYRYGRNDAILARLDTAFGHEGIEFEFSLTESF